MKKHITFPFTVIIALVAIFLASCKGDDPNTPTVKVSSITLTPASASVVVGETTTITAKVAPDNAADKSLAWSSNDESIATVDQTGKVTAVKAGTVTITAAAKDGSYVKGTCAINVTSAVIKVTSITITPKSTSIEVGKTATITAVVSPDNATTIVLTWNSDNTNAATVDEDGKVTAVGVGTATITATATDGSDVKSTCDVTVIPIKVTGITLTPVSTSLVAGKTITITATVAPNNAADKSLAWSSSDESIATVDKTGKVTAVNAGAATITATAKDGSGVKATCTVTVYVKVTSITLTPASTSIVVGETTTVTAKVSPSNATEKSVTWTSSDESIAKIDQTGKVKAIKAGTATITATAKDDSGVKGTSTVKVVDAPYGDGNGQNATVEAEPWQI